MLSWHLHEESGEDNQHSDSATEWRIWGSNTSKSKRFLFSPKGPNRLWSLGSFLFNGNWCSSPGVKRPVREVNHLPQRSAKVKNDRICTFAPFIRLNAVNRKSWNIFHGFSGLERQRNDEEHYSVQSCVPDEIRTSYVPIQIKSVVTWVHLLRNNKPWNTLRDFIRGAL